ncbi:MAG: chemotaxis protein CheW [Desulfobacterales bacterium]|nr:chemotaxis protein CheW [Desulfobacterales bacterium]
MGEINRSKGLESLEEKVQVLTEEIVRNYEELSLLYDLSETFSSTLDIDIIVELVIEKSMEVIDAQNGSVMLLDEHRGYLYLKRNQGRAVKDDFTLKVGEGIAGRVAESAKGIIVNNIAEDPRYIDDFQTDQSLLCTPLKTKNRVIGILKLSDKKRGDIFTANDLKLASAISIQAGLFMENVIFHELKVQEKIIEKEQLFSDDLERLSEKFDFDDEMIQGFVEDCKDLIKEMDSHILELDNHLDNKHLIDGLLRNMHTIKGTAKFFQYQQLSKIAHAIEDVFSLLRDKKIPFKERVIDLLLNGVEIIKRVLADIAETKKDTGHDYLSLVSSLKELKDISVDHPWVWDSGKGGKEPEPDLGRARSETKIFDQTIRIPIYKLNRFTDLIQRMNNVSISYLARIKKKFLRGIQEGDLKKEVQELNLLLPQLEKMYCDTQLQLMNLSNIPIKELFSRFPKMVRTLARELNKEVTLKIYGEDTEVDKAVIEELSGPLVHIIRNAVDHGIESVEDRKRAGKPATATIVLNAHQERGEVIITIGDDGAGLNLHKIKAKAMEKGILSKDEAANMTNQEIIDLVFAPGFSTAKSISDISGRGVGMDVVRESVNKLRGQTYIDTKVGAGTTLTIKVPSTLAISSALIVESNGEAYAVPLSIIKGVTNINEKDVHRVNNMEVMEFRDSVLPLIRLKNMLSELPLSSNSSSQPPVVVISVNGKNSGLAVDKVNEKREILVRPLNKYFKNSRYISGITIVEDSIVPILDIHSIMGSDPERMEQREMTKENIAVSPPLNGDSFDFLIFKLNDDLYGIDLKKTLEIIRYDIDIIRIPGESEWIKGVINLRNNIVPVVDLKKRLGLWETGGHRDGNGSEKVAASNGLSLILMARVNNEAVGFIIDEVMELHKVSRSQIEEVKNRDLLGGEYILGLTLIESNLVKLLNVESI